MVTLDQLNFKQASIRETVVDALQFIGVQEYSDFDLKKEYFNNREQGNHDARHLYRVMIASALIARKLNEPRNGLLAFCGAFIHDLAKYDECDGTQHGPLAAHTKWNMFNQLWDKYALTDDERSNIRAAVSRHSGGGNSHFIDNWVVNQILHDADAFDRCRFHQYGRLDWNYLSHPSLKCTNGHPTQFAMMLIGETEAICGSTQYLPSFIPFQEFIENIR